MKLFLIAFMANAVNEAEKPVKHLVKKQCPLNFRTQRKTAEA